MSLTGAKISSPSDNNSRSIGALTHSAHLRMLSGLAEPATVVVMSGWPIENCRASWAISTPFFWQCSAATAGGFHDFRFVVPLGQRAFVSSRAANGPALMMPAPLCFK